MRTHIVYLLVTSGIRMCDTAKQIQTVLENYKILPQSIVTEAAFYVSWINNLIV
jgi:hypothetical protein